MTKHKAMTTILREELKRSQGSVQQQILFTFGTFGECSSYIDDMIQTLPKEQQKAIKSVIYEGTVYTAGLELEPVQKRQEDFKRALLYLEYNLQKLLEQIQELIAEYHKQEQIKNYLKTK